MTFLRYNHLQSKNVSVTGYISNYFLMTDYTSGSEYAAAVTKVKVP